MTMNKTDKEKRRRIKSKKNRINDERFSFRTKLEKMDY